VEIEEEYRAKQEELGKTLLRDNGKHYVAYRVLPDGSLALLVDLAFTRAICLGATEMSPFTTNRYCYADRNKATELFQKLQSEDDILEGYTATRKG
jgi:hypothetical protein